jgi:DNA-binding Lrp family transcriptional regulator
VRAVADRAHAAQHRQAEGGDEVGVAGTPDGGDGQLGAALLAGDLAGEAEQRGGGRVERHRRAVPGGVDVDAHPRVAGLDGGELDRMFSVPGVRRVNALPALSTLRRGITWDPQFLTDAERSALLQLTGARPEGTAAATPPAKPLSDAERTVVAQLIQDGRASAASIARAAGLPTSTAHRVVRRVLDERWVKPRLEIVSEWLGFQTPFLLRLRVAPGDTPDVMRRLDQLPQTRLAVHVASDMSVLAAGLVTDRSALALFIDNELARIPGILAASAAVMLAEPRRYWLDRDLVSGLGEFHAPTLL